MASRNRLYKAVRDLARKLLLKSLAFFMPATFMLDKRHFETWRNKGYFITPVHFYSPIPNPEDLTDDIFRKKSVLKGIDMRIDGQLDLLELFVKNYKEEYSRIPYTIQDAICRYYFLNGTFGIIDGEILYCMVRHFKPGNIYEVGSGNSTKLIAQALRENNKRDGMVGSFYAIEPFPIQELKDGFAGLTRLIDTKVQNLPFSFFEELGKDDILFIDSSHVIKMGNDVEYLYLEVLPRLKKDVLIHVHDVFIPAEYPPEVVKTHHFFWNEQYLLQAFLQFNNSFEVLWASYYMHLNYPDKLKDAFGSYDKYCDNLPLLPASFWLRKIM